MINSRAAGSAFFKLVFSCVLLCGAAARAQVPAESATPAGGKLSLAVGAVKVTAATTRTLTDRGQINELGRVTEALDAQLVPAFQETRKFDVVARSDLGDLIKEQDLGASGNADAGDPNVAKAGKLAGARYMVVASITDFQDNVQTAEFEGIGKKATKRIVSLMCVAKMYESNTGKLLESASLRIDNSDFVRNPEYLTSEKGASLTEQAIVDLAAMMSSKIANRMMDVLFPAKILALTDGVATINRGDGTGVKADQIWQVSAQGKELVDPDTREVLGREEVSIGWIRITEVQSKFSKGTVCGSDLGIDVGCVARLSNQTACPANAPGGASMKSESRAAGSMVPAAPTPTMSPGAATPTLQSGGASAPAATPYTAAIFITNRCKDIAVDKVSILEDLMVARLEGACFRIISREDVINSLSKLAATGPNQGTQGTPTGEAKTARDVIEVLKGGAERYEDLDKLLSDQSSATALAGNLGCQYVLIGSLTSLDNNVKNFQDERLGVKTENVTYTLTATYKILDAATGRMFVSGEAAGEETYRNTPNLNTQLTLTGPLFKQVSAGMCRQLLAKCGQNQVGAPSESATGGLSVTCTMQDLTVPELVKNDAGRFEFTGNSMHVQPSQLSAVVEIDGVVVGSVPTPNLAALPANSGLHKVAVSRAGFKTWEKTINIRAGGTTELVVPMQLDEPGYERWLANTAFLQNTKEKQQLTDAQVEQMKAFAEYLRNSKFSVDYKVNTTQAPVTIYPGIYGGQIIP
ncbi:MAG: PEGA domain-containing protein [Planctomycetes bacterium]|nr:PEGA domain-containing protein [Planctomycetota bacterium]